MDLIEAFPHDSEMVPLIDIEAINQSQNTYTVIVGKNGVGKSRFISKMASSLIQEKDTIGNISVNDLINIESSEIWTSRKVYFNRKVITISTSPFDKFKIIPAQNYLSKKQYNYTYIGIRSNIPSALNLIQAASIELIEKFLTQKMSSLIEIPKILTKLGFKSKLKIVIKSRIKPRILTEIFKLDKDTISKKLIDIKNNNPVSEEYFNANAAELILSQSKETILHIIDALEKIEEINHDKNTFYINLLSNAKLYHVKKYYINYDEYLKDILLLLSFDLIKISDIILQKNDQEEMSLINASSGEQCIIIIMLGIAGNIKNGSFIFLDEPEISLHPQWQEDFMPMLIKAFSIYRSCQFFIATHSPQIVSGMKGENCFVTDLASKKLYPASFFSGKSADFQLAEIFGSPGQMNEYLSRLCFNLIFKLRNKKEITESDYDDLDTLKKSKRKIKANDPIIALIETVEEIFKNASY